MIKTFPNKNHAFFKMRNIEEKEGLERLENNNQEFSALSLIPGSRRLGCGPLTCIWMLLSIPPDSRSVNPTLGEEC